MYDILMCKFSQNPGLKERLLSTKDEGIQEGNTWHDNYWGVCLCGGCEIKNAKNKLGKTLMKIREELKEK